MEDFLIFKRIMMLGERHGAGIEPAVNNLRNPSHGLAAMRTLICHFIYIRSVKFNRQRVIASCLLLQFLPAADGLLITAAFTLPDIERSAPVTVSGDAPVLHILKPLAKTAFSDSLGDPVDSIVVSDQIVTNRGHLYEP